MNAIFDKINDTYYKLKDSHQHKRMLAIDTRIKALKDLAQSINKHKTQIFDALHLDLNKCSFESYVTEIAIIKQEIELNIKSLKSWSKPKKVHTPIAFLPGKSAIEYVPRGLVLIMAPWNYPIQLCFMPLISAIAAGNCAVLKPSEHAAHSAQLIKKIVNEALDQRCFEVINGDVNAANILLDKVWDYIFYTGSTKIGREVMKKAALHLTPLTLELGGKSPVIIHESANLAIAAKRIMWGKCLNAGQTCTAPDYVLIKSEQMDPFIKFAKNALLEMFGPDPQKSDSYGRIINEAHSQRIVSYMSDGHIVHGGAYDLAHKYIEPTILNKPKLDSALMNEEIFGPLLPIIEYKELDEALEFVASRPHPLALYLFANDQKVIKKVSNMSQSGSLGINDVLSQAVISGLPFGGVGASGMGAYHGYFGFLAMSHQRACHQRTNIFDIPLRYPPFTQQKLRLAKTIL